MADPTTTTIVPTLPQTPTRNLEPPTQNPASSTSTSPPPNGAPALATTKRKFHRLLEGITRSPANPSNNTATTTNTTINPESSAKRIRLEARTRLAASTATNTSPTTAFIQAQLLSSRLAAAAHKPTDSRTSLERKEPNYLPRSQAQFLARLRTFADVRQWTSKPEAVGEVEWAKRGWLCVGVNMVACKGGCEKRVVVGLRAVAKDEEGVEVEGSEDFSVDVGESEYTVPVQEFPLTTSPADDELVRRYVDIIVTGHEESCLWRGAGCGDDIYRLQIAQPSIWQPQLRDRYRSFISLAKNLPPPNSLILPSNINAISTQLPSTFFTNPTPVSDISSTPTTVINTTINPTALALSLLGWTGSPDPAVATCSACFRRIGLWLYCPSQHSLSADVQPSQSMNDENQSDSIMKLDLAGNHRDYCPWINATSQHMQGSFSGFAAGEVLVRLLCNEAASRRSYQHSHNNTFHEPLAQTTFSKPDGTETAPAKSQETTDFSIVEQGATASEEVTNPLLTAMTPEKRREEVEREDKVRFAKLKELKRMLGFGKGKGKGNAK